MKSPFVKVFFFLICSNRAPTGQPQERFIHWQFWIHLSCQIFISMSQRHLSDEGSRQYLCLSYQSERFSNKNKLNNVLIRSGAPLILLQPLEPYNWNPFIWYSENLIFSRTDLTDTEPTRLFCGRFDCCWCHCAAESSIREGEQIATICLQIFCLVTEQLGEARERKQLDRTKRQIIILI